MTQFCGKKKSIISNVFFARKSSVCLRTSFYGKNTPITQLKHCKYGECNHVGLRSLFDFLNKIYGEKI